MNATSAISIEPAEKSWAEASALTERAYTPEDLAYEKRQGISWADAQQWIMLRIDGRLCACVGLHHRHAVYDDRQVTVGGLGGVKVDREWQGKGLGRQIVEAAMAELETRDRYDFGFLVCNEDKIAFYEKLGWQKFSGTVLHEKLGKPQPFDAKNAMTLALKSPAPTGGTLDLCGKPW